MHTDKDIGCYKETKQAISDTECFSHIGSGRDCVADGCTYKNGAGCLPSHDFIQVTKALDKDGNGDISLNEMKDYFTPIFKEIFE